MRVLVTGGYGLIGAAVVSQLHREGHAIVGAGRNVAQARRRAPFARRIEADFNKLTDASAWLPLLDGIDAVVNCVGVLEQGGLDDIRRIHVDGTVALFEACLQEGIRRVVHISAIGASAQGATDFAQTKAQADAHLVTLDLDWAILRPALVLADAAYGGTAMLRTIAACPFITPTIVGAERIQVVGIDDVAATVAFCLVPGAPGKVTWELAHPQVHTLGDIAAALRGWLGFPERPLVAMPAWLIAAVGALASFAGLLGWRSPARPTALAQLRHGVVGDPEPWAKATGIEPKSLADILAARPAGVQERWFAQLYLIKPVAILGLAMFWIATGLVATGPGRESAVAQFAATGFSAKTAELVVLLGAGFDVVLGVLLVFRRLARRVLIVMAVATLGYLLAGSILAPQLWLDPLGPLLKIVPMLVATLLTLAIMDDR